MTRMDGLAIVITGSGRGIGAATARLAASLGARIVVNDLDVAEAEKVATEIRAAGGQAVAQPADIARWDEARALIDRCVAEWGRIDGLFNNAGLFRMAKLAEENEAELRAMLEVNIVGTFACAFHALAHMKRQGKGAIVNVTSGAHMGTAAMGAYAASKGAVASATYVWAGEVAGTGIRVNALSPMAQTRMADVISDYFGNAKVVGASAENNAATACYLLSDAASGVNGQVVRIDGRNLSLVSHPGVALPTLEGEWTIDAVAKAFRDDLGKRQFPIGVVGLHVEVAKTAGGA